MPKTIVLALVLGVALATASRSNDANAQPGPPGLTCSGSRGGGRGIASTAVILSPSVGSTLSEGSVGQVEVDLLSNRRLRFERVSMNLLFGSGSAPLNQGLSRLSLEVGSATLTSGDICGLDLHAMVTNPLPGEVLAQLFGLGGAARAQVVLREGSILQLSGTPGDFVLGRRGCARVCVPALGAACRASCEGQQRCVRQCRRVGLQACRETGSCRQG